MFPRGSCTLWSKNKLRTNFGGSSGCQNSHQSPLTLWRRMWNSGQAQFFDQWADLPASQQRNSFLCVCYRHSKCLSPSCSKLDYNHNSYKLWIYTCLIYLHKLHEKPFHYMSWSHTPVWRVAHGKQHDLYPGEWSTIARHFNALPII